MNWDDMRFFLALSREGSISAAGRSLGVNHTTVARRITALEDMLGTRLFDRLPAGYEMTQSAEDLYRHALEMEAHAQAIDREVFGQDAALKGPLKLTVAHDVAIRLLIKDLRNFRNEYPCIDLEILTTPGLVDLASRQADIAVRLTAKPPDYLVGREVTPIRHGVYGSQKYLKEMNGPIEAILFRGDTEHPEWLREHFPEPTSVLRTDDATTMLTAVREHHGLARLPCLLGDSDPDVRRLDVRLTPSTWGIWILSHVDLRSTARVRVCREFLIAAIEDKRELILGENSKYFES